MHSDSGADASVPANDSLAPLTSLGKRIFFVPDKQAVNFLTGLPSTPTFDVAIAALVAEVTVCLL